MKLIFTNYLSQEEFFIAEKKFIKLKKESKKELLKTIKMMDNYDKKVMKLLKKHQLSK